MKQLLFMSISLACAISISTSCHKKKADPPEPIDLTAVMPPATQIGANTFGCYINGELFVAASNNYNSVIPIYCSYNSISENELRIQGSRRNDTVQDNVRFTALVDAVGDYSVLTYSSIAIGYRTYYYYYGECDEYFHNENEPGVIEITHLDPNKRIISGSFSFDLIGKDCSDEILSITDGRFDMTY